MRADRAAMTLAVALACATAGSARAQSAADGPVLRGLHLRQTAAVKIWVPAGQLRLVAWDRDSLLVRGRIAPGAHLFFGGDSNGAKFGTEDNSSNGDAGPSQLVVYVPRRGTVSVKGVSVNVDSRGVSGWFYTVSGSIHLAGNASSIEVESMNGNLDLNVTTPYLRARTGDGHLLIRGAPQDVDASTIAGTLDVAATSVMRAQFGSVSGDIHYVGSPATGGIFEFSNHSGSVDLVLPQAVSGVFALSSIIGRIENDFVQVRPTATTPHSMRLSFGRGGAQVAVRTFRGTIRVRPQ